MHMGARGQHPACSDTTGSRVLQANATGDAQHADDMQSAEGCAQCSARAEEQLSSGGPCNADSSAGEVSWR